jgi:methionine synthase II (cobalamin-independent)
MGNSDKPPFRADHVGSLLRPTELHSARERAQAGAISRDQLREVRRAGNQLANVELEIIPKDPWKEQNRKK